MPLGMRLGGLAVDGFLRGPDLGLGAGRPRLDLLVLFRAGRLLAILPVSHLGLQPITLLRARHVVSLTASILAGLAMPGNRPTHSRRPTVPERQSTPTR